MGLLAGGVQHGSQDRVVPGPGRAAEAAGDFLLDLEGSQRPFRFIVGGRNRGIAGEPQHALLVVLQPEHPVVAPSSFPLAPVPFRGRRRPGFVPGEPGEPFAGPCHQSRDGALRHPHAEQVDPCLAQPLHRGGPSARTACDR
ncbi:MAG: hypothetical protein OXC53_07090 [Rhodobacteraceae bacterium]|nr:hypothetical protein [Paracoccaceae bacterium]